MEYIASVKLRVKPGRATPAPPLGPALGQYGVNLKDCADWINKASLALTKLPTWVEEEDSLVRVQVYITRDKRFDVVVHDVSVVDLLKKTCQIKKGASDVKETIKTITIAQVMAIAKRKLKDSNAYEVERFSRSVIGTARSMGIKVLYEGNA